MRFMHRHRRWLSLSVLAGLFAAMTTPPASAEYNPRTGRYLQQDPNGQALVLQALRHNAENPMVTVSMAYQLQYGDGMNFYEYLRSNPANDLDPAGLGALYAERLSVASIMATLGTGVASAAGTAQAWLATQLGTFVAYQYATAMAVLSAGALAVNSVDPAALSAVQSEFVNWMSSQSDKYSKYLHDGFNRYSEQVRTGGSGQDPNDWRRLVEKIPDLETLRFGQGALQKMQERNIHRSVIEDVLKNGTRVPDPKGAVDTWMYYRQMWINGKDRMVEVLWNAETNTVWHTMYTNIPK